jgi:hypothetical protein
MLNPSADGNTEHGYSITKKRRAKVLQSVKDLSLQEMVGENLGYLATSHGQHQRYLVCFWERIAWVETLAIGKHLYETMLVFRVA